jgi:hypothetical protein
MILPKRWIARFMGTSLCKAKCVVGGQHEYAYPNEPQYQYPRTDGKGMKCPKGQMPYQGKCRPVRWLLRTEAAIPPGLWLWFSPL